MSWDRWEAKAGDVPRGRVTRSLRQGFAGLSNGERTRVAEKRADALDRLRAAAGAARTPHDREKIWALVASVGTGDDQPSWEQLIACEKLRDFLSLAMRSEHAAEDAGNGGTASDSELRTVRQSAMEYLAFKHGFGANTYKGTRTVLLRAIDGPDPKSEEDEEVVFGDRLVAHVTRADGDAIVRSLATISEPKASTLDDYRKHLHAWYNWELTKEEERAEDRRRKPLFTANPFTELKKRYSSPNLGRHQTVEEQEHGRRFHPHEIEAILAEADVRTRTAFLTCYKLGLRPGELIHLRWGKDVRPLGDGTGFRVDVQGGESRGRDSRCGCPACGTTKGWAPKNGTRSYHLDRVYDQIGWIADLCDALDSWVTMLKPAHGTFLFPSPVYKGRAWSNQNLNQRLHAIATELRESKALPDLETGLRKERRLTMHSWRHSCASRMVEIGVPVPLAAAWIGDTLATFMRVYARPDAKEIAKATLAGYGRNGGRNQGGNATRVPQVG
ncbi:MAG: site-specific integrase [Gemmatimonadota bacterium]|nr:site-specific integrase [Gemmatimonadota bacterium]